jgi:SAM-dependent methyltransferase
MKKNTSKENRIIADQKKLQPFLKCQDHAVSRETFDLFLDPEKQMLVTVPRPDLNDLPAYYESEDYISHTDSTRTLVDRAYQFVKNYSVKKKLGLINSLVDHEGSILDIGCGTGDFLSVCQKGGWRINGIEPNEKARSIASDKISNEGAVTDVIDAYLKTHKESFDVITMWHVLEHVPNLEQYIEHLKLLLKPEGWLIVAVPNFNSYDAKHYREFWAAYDVPRHLWHFSDVSIKQIFQEFDFKVRRILPLVFDSFYVSILSEKYKSGKSNLLKAFRIGLLSNLKARRSRQYSSLIYLIKKAN